jgi:hypothetical protein
VISGGNDSEIVPETEVQDLVSADSSSKVAMKWKDVLGAFEDDGARKVVAEPVFVGIDPNAETDDQFIVTKEMKTLEKDKSVIEEHMVSCVDLSFEDFKLEWMLLFYPDWAYPLLRRLKREREEKER